MSGARSLLSVSGLSVEFYTRDRIVKAVQDVSFEVAPGETLAILGESGSGKSVSAAAIMNLIDSPPGRITAGSIEFDGIDLLTASPGASRRINGHRIAMIFQDPLAALNPVFSVGWQIMELYEAHGVRVDNPRQAAIDLLRRVGIPDPERRVDDYPHQFSGGQRQRVMIAIAVALGPELLIADEPTTALDVTIQAQILRLLKDLQRDSGMSVLLITHDLAVVAEFADRVVVMQGGRIVEAGTVRDVLARPAHPYTKRLLDAIPGRYGFREHLQVSGEPLIEVRGLVKKFGPFTALKGVDLTFVKGQTLGIVGESGSGKSTLARIILGLETWDQGEVLIEGKPLSKMDRADLFALRRKLQVVFQDPSASLNPMMTVEQIISEPWRIHRGVLPRSQWPARVRRLLEQVGLDPEFASRHPHQFSGGQRQRIAIARALALDPEVIVCDEAVSALDVSIQAQVIELLRGLRQSLGLSYIFIAHDLPVVRDFCDELIVMKDGAIVERGPTEQMFRAPRAAYTQELLAASPLLESFLTSERD